MANLCKNRLSAAGTSPRLAAFKEAVGRSPDGQGRCVFDLEQIAPSPAELRDAELVEWRADHWGPSRNVEEVETIVDEPNRLVITFTSAWAAPIPALERVVREHPGVTLSLEYYDAGSVFAGALRLKNGQVVHEDFVDGDDEKCLALLEREGWPEGARDYRDAITSLE